MMLGEKHTHARKHINTQKQTPFSSPAFHNTGCSLKSHYKLQAILYFLQQGKEPFQVLVSILSPQQSKLLTQWRRSAYSVPKHLNFLNVNLQFLARYP